MLSDSTVFINLNRKAMRASYRLAGFFFHTARLLMRKKADCTWVSNK